VKGLIDISPALRVGMGVFPGDADFAVSQTFTIGPDCPVNVASFSMSTHCGAHVDAPLHYDPAGASIDMLDLGDFIGPARVIDARGKDPLCGFEEIASALDGAPATAFEIDGSGRSVELADGIPALAPETVERLAVRGMRLIGVDVPSVDPETSKSLRRTWFAGGTMSGLSRTLYWPTSYRATTN
jgi:arylformamidase